MTTRDKTLWLGTEASACDGCAPSPAGPVCVGHQGVPCAQPLLEGEVALLGRALTALRAVADEEGNLVDTHRFTALRVRDGEAELKLVFPRRCGPTRLLADDAFQALRRALPDTDVYVQLAD